MLKIVELDPNSTVERELVLIKVAANESNRSDVLEIVRLFRQNGYQIVHSHMITLSVLSLWGAKRAGVPNRIAHNHSTVGRGERAKNVMKYLHRPFAAV